MSCLRDEVKHGNRWRRGRTVSHYFFCSPPGRQAGTFNARFQMKPPLPPEDETSRMEALRRYELLDTLPEQALDDLTALAAHICGTPISLISLVDEKRQWFKSKIGLAASETPREVSFCGHALLQPDLFIVLDASRDERFADNPLVTGDPNVRFYAGTPLLTPEGKALGTLCVIDRVPRQLTEFQAHALRVLGRQVMTQLELRRQSRELAEHEAHLRAIINNEPECVKLLAADGSLLEMNPAGLKMIEADSLAQVAGQRLYPMVAPEQRGQFQALTERVMRGGSGILEFQITGLKGGHRWLETHANPLRDASGKVTALLGLTRDITARKQAEAERDRLFNLSLDMLCVAGLDGFFKQLNPAWSKTLGWSDAELLNQPWVEFVHPDDRERTEQARARLNANQSMLGFENRYQCKDGTYRWISWNTFPLPTEGVAVAVARDITERKLAEDALRKSETNLAAAQRRAKIGNWELDLATQTGTWSAEMFRLFGREPSLGTPTFAEFVEMIHPEDRESFRHNFAHATAEQNEIQTDFRIVRPDGSVGWIEGRSELIFGASGQPLRLVGTWQDITERKHAGAALQFANQRLAFIAQMTSEVLGIKSTVEIAQCLASQTQQCFDADACVIRVLENDELVLLGAQGVPREQLPTRMPVFGLARQILESRQPVVIADALTHPLTKDVARPAPGTFSFVSYAGVPLLAEDKIVGVLGIFAVRAPRRFTAVDIEHLQIVANHTAISLSNERLFKAVQAQKTQLEAALAERKQAELRVRRLNRTYAVLSDIHQTIVREKDSQTMLAAACRIAVEKGGFGLAWIGLVDAGSRQLHIRANVGADAGTLEILNGLIAIDPPAGCAFTHHTLQTGGHGVCNDIAHDPQAVRWSAAALQRNYRAMAAFPLKAGGKIIGTFNLYAGEPAFFDTEELRLLDELAADISFSLEVHEHELQRQQTERDLRASEERFRQAVENIHEVIWITDTAKNQMLYISPAYEKIWGQTCQSLYESPWSWLEPIHPEDRDRVLHAAQTKQAAGKYDEEYRLVHPDGTVRWINDKAFPVRDEQGAVYRIVGVAEDITERKNAARLALRSQRLQSIGTLAGGVAHDLNNALAPITMGVEMLKMQYPQESETLDMFEACAKRGADLVRQLLSFAKGAEGEHVALQPTRLVADLEKIMKGSFPKNIQLAVQCDSSLPTILGDATQLDQILLNLCVNARDAMPRGGTLALEAQYVEMDAAYASSIPDAKPGNYVMLRVRDTGTGIPPEIIDRIFDPFFTTKGPDKGTGLGLSTVMGIVKGHGGFLQVYSQPGQGSTFAAYLPAANAGSDPERLAKLPSAFRGQGELILFVDDEAAVREMAQAVLRRLNCNVVTATDGLDGLIQLAEHRTELRAIVTDLHMPHMDGLAFVRSLRGMLPDIPVLVASGRLDEAVAEEFKTLGVTSRLDKPFTELQLAEALKNLLAPK